MRNRITFSTINSRVQLRKLASANFPDFVCRVLARTYPGIKVFGAHKDGAIDLVAEDSRNRRTVFQCKSISGAKATARSAWRKEMESINNSLKLLDDGSLVGQSQYEPWRNIDRPIVQYIFCHNQFMPDHQGGRDKVSAENIYLQDKIRNFFTKNIATRPGFGHLANLLVTVYSGDDLADECDQQKKVAFDIFGAELPASITRVDHLLSDNKESDTFSAYLSSKLPYFSRANFKAASEGRWADFIDENTLVDRLFEAPQTEPILIVTGPGGYGKSRLTIEMCQIAQKAPFVYYPWLQALNSRNRTERSEMLLFLVPHLKEWIESDRNKLSWDASFVFSGWLWASERAGAYYATEAVSYLEIPLKEWLGRHALKVATAIVFASWFRAASRTNKELSQRAVGVVRSHAMNWLEMAGRANLPEARLLYTHWLFAAASDRGLAADTLAILQPHILNWLSAGQRADMDTERLYFAYLLAAARVSPDASSSAIGLLRPAMIEWLDSNDNSGKKEAEFVFTGWLRAAVAAGPPVAEDAINVLGNLVEQWLIKFGAQDRRGYVRNPWRDALRATKRAVPEELENDWSDRWWTFSRGLDRLVTEEDEKEAANELTSIVDQFFLPDHLSETERRTWINDLLIGSRYLARYRHFLEPLCTIFVLAIRHPTLFQPPLQCDAKVSSSHIIILAGLLERRSLDPQSPSDRALIRHFMDGVLGLRKVEGEDESIAEAVRALRQAYPFADIWDD